MKSDATTGEDSPPRRPSPRESGDEARWVLEVAEDLNAVEDTDELLDRLAEHAARVAGYNAALLSLALPEGAMVGTFNLPEEDRLRFKRRAQRTNIEYRVEKRARIRRFAFPGTNIAFVPHDADLDRAPLSEAYLSRDRPDGSWHSKDRLFILVTGSGGKDIGVYSLDYPLDGNAPSEKSLGPLLLAERLLALGGSLLQTRLLERGLRRSEEEVRTLVEDAPVGIYRRGEGGRLLSVNLRLAAVFGYGSPEEMLADPGARGLVEPPEVAALLDSLEEGRDLSPREATTRRSDGTVIRVRVSARRLPGRDFTLGIVEDVTEAHRMAEYLQRARRMEAVGTLASGIAHDFNNILCGILGYASHMRSRTAVDPRLDAGARAIEEAAQRGADLTRRLLGIAREAPSERRAVDVAEVVQDCARIARETFDRRIAVEVACEPGLPPVRGNASDIHQAILNLCINARDSMPGGGRLLLSAAPAPEGPGGPATVAPPAGWVRVSVRDEGSGMDEATRARLFEPFFTTKQRGKGTGLGLYMVYNTVQAHGGTVEVDTAPGRGTRFDLFLPAGEPAGEEAAPVAGGDAGGRAGPARILLVEDEAMIRDLSCTVLEEEGHRVLAARDGQEAVDLLEGKGAAFDLVVLDLVLPRLSGADVFRRLRARHPSLPVILSSGNVDEGLLDQDLRAEVAGLLPKPYRPADLLAAVGRVLDDRTAGG